MPKSYMVYGDKLQEEILHDTYPEFSEYSLVDMEFAVVVDDRYSCVLVDNNGELFGGQSVKDPVALLRFLASIGTKIKSEGIDVTSEFRVKL